MTNAITYAREPEFNARRNGPAFHFTVTDPELYHLDFTMHVDQPAFARARIGFLHTPDDWLFWRAASTIIDLRFTPIFKYYRNSKPVPDFHLPDTFIRLMRDVSLATRNIANLPVSAGDSLRCEQATITAALRTINAQLYADATLRITRQQQQSVMAATLYQLPPLLRPAPRIRTQEQQP